MLSAPFVLILTWIRLRSRGYRAALAATRAKRLAGNTPTERQALARETAYALAVAVKYGPWHPRCLLRSLALGWFLGRKDIPFELRIGLPTGVGDASGIERPGFAAHAWVEVDGVVINDREDVGQDYASFASR